jgi:hypothetical protein
MGFTCAWRVEAARTSVPQKALARDFTLRVFIVGIFGNGWGVMTCPVYSRESEAP